MINAVNELKTNETSAPQTKDPSEYDTGDSEGRNENHTKWAIFSPQGPLQEAKNPQKTCKKSKLGQTKKYTSRNTHNDARNIKKGGLIDTGNSEGWNEFDTPLTLTPTPTDGDMMTIPISEG